VTISHVIHDRSPPFFLAPTSSSLLPPSAFHLRSLLRKIEDAADLPRKIHSIEIAEGVGMCKEIDRDGEDHNFHTIAVLQHS
jgi:hypothetical protein